MKQRSVIEFGEVKYFRIFTLIQFISLSVFFATFLILNHWPISSSDTILSAVALLEAGILYIYLSIPKLIPVLGRNYLPIGIIWATFLPLIQVHVTLISISINFDKSNIFMFIIPELFLFIPLIIVAWHYSRKIMLAYCGITLLFDVMSSVFYELSSNFHMISPLIPTSFLRTIAFIMIGVLISNLSQIQRQQQKKLLDANKQLTEYASTLEQLTTSRERNRMARELHDILAHTLSGIAIELEAVRAVQRDDPDKAKKLIEKSLEAVRGGLSETRLALQDLRSTPIQDLGLGLALQALVDSMTSRKNFQVEVQVNNTSVDLPNDVQQCFYRVAQEALVNVANHSSARHAVVTLIEDDWKLVLTIIDDGKGFNPSLIDTSKNFGLLGMKERAEMIGANLQIHSHVGTGTKIILEYEYQNSREKYEDKSFDL